MPAIAFTPKDRTRREHIAQLDRVVFSDDDRPFVILRLNDGASALGTGIAEQFVRGQQYRFHGRWKDGKHGPEFHFETFTLDSSLTEPAVTKYLSETCRNVGVATARRLWEKYRGDAVRMLREEPRAVADAGILAPDAAEETARDLERFRHVEKTKVELFGLFAGHGFPGKLIDRCIALWGVAAPQKIRINPFSLLVNRLPGCGFKRCDKLYLDMGKNPAALKRQAMCALNVMKEDRTGSTWLDADDVAAETRKAVPSGDPYRALVLLRRGGLIRVRRDESKRFIAPRQWADDEARIADNVRRLMRSPSAWPTEILTTVVEGDGLPSQHQADELKRATSGAVGCFVGVPGTGKTHSLSFLLKQLIAEHGPNAIAVAAPTGKAAVRACESLRSRGLDITATTIHRLLEIGRNGHDGDGWEFERNSDNPLNVRFLVLDESSMIDTGLMADLLDALPDTACVLFVGDPYQLPPVGHGAPLRDLLAAGVPQGELTELRRNAGAIVQACAAIKAGVPVTFCDRFNLTAECPDNLRILDAVGAEAIEALSETLDSMTSFDRVWETQIIVPLNEKSDVSRTKINERLGNMLNPDGKSAAGNPFRVGDKIICLRNTRLKTVAAIADRWGNPDMPLDAANYQPCGGPRDASAEWYVANGEIGRVVAVSPKATIARFGGVDVPLVTITKKRTGEAPAGEGETAESAGNSDFDHAWAITVHRSQGSEWPCVIVMVDDAGTQISDRNFWYTAISRARSACLLIGPRGVFDRQVKRVSLTRRRTFLSELLQQREVMQ